MHSIKFSTWCSQLIYIYSSTICKHWNDNNSVDHFLRLLHLNLGVVLTSYWALCILNWSYHSVPVLSQGEFPNIYTMMFDWRWSLWSASWVGQLFQHGLKCKRSWFQSYSFSSLKTGNCRLASCELQEYPHSVFSGSILSPFSRFWIDSANINYWPSANFIILEWRNQLSMSSRWNKNNVGLRIDPCGTPLKNGNAFDKWLS